MRDCRRSSIQKDSLHAFFKPVYIEWAPLERLSKNRA